MPTMYNAALSPFAGRVRIAQRATGFALELADPPGGLHSDTYKAITPIDKLPVMVDGGLTLPESQVILEYLDEKYAGGRLSGSTPEDRAQARLLCRLADLYIFPPLSVLFGQLSPKTRDAAVVTARVAELEKGLKILDHYVSGTDTATGKAFSIADCTLPTVLFFVSALGPAFGLAQPYAATPKLGAYLAAVNTNKDVAPVIAEMAAALKKLQGG
ncbi:glutathione S-transferase family protein [Zavarzinia sp. CC-PAN008]|uniref:glutathione S-transferase family protein n=1 Tax=Zavarzinia sp. CC-PAN008 TaxID=3243332 RepID=UPI003F747559